MRARRITSRAVASVVTLGVVIALAASFFPVRTVLRTDVMSVLREQYRR